LVLKAVVKSSADNPLPTITSTLPSRAVCNPAIAAIFRESRSVLLSLI